MKITDIQVIRFKEPRRPFRNGKLLPETTVYQTLTKVLTDQGAKGYYFGGAGHDDKDGMTAEESALLEGRLKSIVFGDDPFERKIFLALDVDGASES